MPETPASSPDSTSAQSSSVAAAASQTSVAVLGTQQLIPPSSATLVRSSRKGPKRFSHKVRTGCITCKIRRVKCDETRPACLRCKKTGRVCDGYRFGNEDAPGLTAAVPDSSSRIIVPAPTVVQPGYMPTTHAGWTPSEKRALDFYLRFSVPSLFSGVAGSFWGRVIPALCQQEPAIRHAVFAVSSLHENLFCGTGPTGGRPSMNYFATVSYGKALRSLQTWKVPLDRKGAGAASLALPLVACALFICIEFMRGDPAAALLHISQGRRILARLDAATMASPTAELMRREIAPVFSKLAVASFMTGADPEPIPSLFRWTSRRAVGKMEFADMREAEQAIFEIVDDGLRFAKTARFWQHNSGYLSGDDVRSPELAALEERREQLLSLARRWSTAFAALQASTPEPLNQVPVMYLHAANVVVGMALDRREMCYDDYTAEFANMVLLGKNVLDAEDARNNSAGRNAPATTAFTFDSELIPPLYFTVLKSRHPGLRRDALALLQRHSAGCHKENVWDSKQASKVAERMVTLEEHRGWKIVGKVDSNPLPGASRKLSLHEKKVGEIAVDWMPSLFDEDGKPQERSGAHQLRVQPARRPILGHDSGAPAGGLPTFTDPGISPRDFSELRRFLDGPQQPVHPALAEEAWAALTRSSPLQYQGSHTGADDLATRWASVYDVPVCLRVPQEARIHNTIVDPGVDGGLWTSFFVEPDRFDPSRVGILREFIPLG